MDGFAVRQQDNAKVPIVHLWHLAPASDAPIRLNFLPNWRLDGALNPCVLDQRSVGALTYGLEITRDLHTTKVTEGSGATGCRLTVKLRGRTTTPDERRRRTLSPRARGANPLPHHGPSNDC